MKFGTIVSGVCGAVFLTGAMLMGSSYWVGQTYERTLADSSTLMQSMRQQMFADMMHDAMRGVVYRSLYGAATGNAAMLEAARGEIDEYGDAFTAAIDSQGALDLPADIRGALDEVATPLTGYIDAARAIVADAGSADAARVATELARFEESFSLLEGAMESVSDTIEAVDARNASAAEAVQMVSLLLNVGGLVLIVILTLSITLMSRRFVVAPLTNMTANMGHLAGGKLDIVLPPRQPIAEMARMADSLAVFQTALQSRAALAAEAEATAHKIQQRISQSAQLNRSLAEVVGAAAQGDFTRRVDTSFDDRELSEVAGAVNNLVAVVDGGLNETSGVLAALGRAELDQRVGGQYKGAFGQLKADTNAVADRLVEIVGQLKATSAALKIATSEILSGANDLSERTTRQAATIEETSAAMEQLAQTVVDNASRAETASRQAAVVSQSVQEGGAVMSSANLAMQAITQSSDKISSIIGVIDDIAFQTNLLALNASVEAARAGDAGSGFAVVAVEVRRLAQSAAQASTEIKQLIERSAQEVAGGSKLVSDAAARLAEMLSAVVENHHALDAIARASRQQAGSIEEVTVAVRQMDEMTQHNAALVEQTNAAIEQTEAQAGDLDRMVGLFKLGKGAARRAA